MKKTLFIFFILIFLFIHNISGQELGSLYTERSAGFTISMPRGWQTIDVGLKYLSIRGPQDGSFTPNLVFIDEELVGPLSSYIDVVVGYYPLILSDFRLINRATFVTNAGVTAEYVTYQGTMGSISVRQRMYFIPNRRGTTVMQITCTAPFVGGERYDAVFDASVRTFNWTR